MVGSNRVLKKRVGFKLHKETIALAIRSVDPPWKAFYYAHLGE